MVFLLLPALLLSLYFGWHLTPLFRKLTSKTWLVFVLSFAAAIIIAVVAVLTRTVALGFLFYCLMFLLVFDLLRLIFRLFFKDTKAREVFLRIYAKGLTAAALALVISVIGYFNVYRTTVTRYDVQVSGGSERGDTLRVAMMADVHLGSVLDNKRLQEILDETQALEPDILFLVGDIFVEDTTEGMLEEALVSFSKLRIPLGIYYVTGNHEYYTAYGGIGDIEDLAPRLERAGIRLLLDETVLIDSRFYLIGRRDYSQRNRASLLELTEGLDPAYPVLMLDHQPKMLQDIGRYGIDVSFSGHTHAGQLFPLGQLAELFGINEKNYGLSRAGNATVVITSGIGVWGFPLRFGSPSEIVLMEIS